MRSRKFYPAFSLFRQHSVEQTRSLRVAHIQLIVGKFAGVRAPPRFSGKALEHTRPTAC